MGTKKTLKEKWLGRIGHHVFRGTDTFFASQSRIATDAVLAPGEAQRAFPWAAELAERAPAIATELRRLLRHRELLPAFQDIAAGQARISPDDRWRVFVLYGFGRRSAPNCALCPETARVLDTIPDLETAFFSVLAPGKHIPAHRGISRGFVRAHLGLVVPERADRCRMEVDAQPVVWREGEVLFFDDSRPHEVWNDTEQERVVLLIDVRRPMRLPGRLLLASLMTGLRTTFFVRDAVRKQRAWEAGGGQVLRERFDAAARDTRRPQGRSIGQGVADPAKQVATSIGPGQGGISKSSCAESG